MKRLSFLLAFIAASCSLGHKEVRYNEMAGPPRLILQGDNILVRTQNSKEYPSFFIYEIFPMFDEGDRVILLRGYEAMYRDVKNEFKVNITNIKADSISAYKIYWVDPDLKKTELKLERE
ncbi:MAG TPA: hypothetical protein VL728_13610 [Cyclobacteriaceae bacterium]|jgi:hypothetical protein|nr:hypothetical protein [Cyclobacteriaceae bacterium]